ncbi:helix-turn-helix domain-containing protein [Pseudorhodobacter sp. W20_MBD10_FR17]|uniref:helix-turn-helix domain-containing protein n=1 Tax=Pseudorhodobacter sp. W20_MBD10_FR17 TaxID=3240266 RepID=UPI003F9CEF7F
MNKAVSPNDLIAEAVQRERLRAGLSLSALAEAAGVAKSTLSQLEARKGNPSIETLWAIAAALGVPFAQFFEVSAPDVVVIRAGEGDAVAAETSGDVVVLLANCPLGVRRDLYRMALMQGAGRRAAAHPAGTVEHAFVCAGRVRIGPEARVIEAGPGDYYRYPADGPHWYEALGGDALVLVVMESPR